MQLNVALQMINACPLNQMPFSLITFSDVPTEVLISAMDSFAIHLSTQEMPAPFALASFKPPFDGDPSESSLLKVGFGFILVVY